jgi:anti-anti-sigma factor
MRQPSPDRPAASCLSRGTGEADVQLASSQLAQAPLIVIDGECDHRSAETLHAAVGEALSADPPAILLDLEKCTYIDSGGISVLLGMIRRLRGRGWLGVLAPNDNVRRLLEIIGLTVDAGFRVFDHRDDASLALEELRE